MTQFSAFHNNENMKQQTEQKQARNTSSLAVKPLKKFVDTQGNLLEVNNVNDSWSTLFADSEFDLKLSQHFTTPLNSLSSPLVHQSLSMIKYKPKTAPRGIQKKDTGLMKKLIALQKRLSETEQLYNQQKTINEDLTEIVEKYQMKEEEEEKKKPAAKPASQKSGFYLRKFQ